MPKTDNQQVKSRRDAAVERLKSRYPEREFNDDEEIFGQISDDYDELDSQLSDYKQREGELTNLFTSDPRSALFLDNWRNGEHPMTAFIREFGKDGLEELLNNDEKMEEFAKANEEYLTRVAKNKELEETFDQNLSELDKTLDQWQADNGLSDDQVDEVLTLLTSIANDAITGKFSRESLDMALKAVNHDADVTDAGIDGEVRGRNAKIDEKLRKRSAGDGTASLDGKNSQAGNAAPKMNLGALDKFDDSNKNIWERGGEKRTKY